jgi:hypothetical protein
VGRALSSKVSRKTDETATRRPLRPGCGVTLGAPLLPQPAMQRLRDFYRRYKQYILSDALMYIVFIVVLALMFVFFG